MVDCGYQRRGDGNVKQPDLLWEEVAPLAPPNDAATIGYPANEMSARSARVEAVDVIIIGSGAGGMTAAVTVARLGLKVVLLEKAKFIGGATAWSAGAAWLPGSRHLAPEPDPTAPFTYIENIMGNRMDGPIISAMLETGPLAVQFLEENTSVKFRIFGGGDYRTDLKGASSSSRTLEPQPFDDRALGDAHRLLRDPFPPFTIFHGMQTDGEDLAHLQNALHSPRALLNTLKILTRHYFQLITLGRSTRRVRGNALVGMLLKSAIDLGVDVRVGSHCRRLLSDEGRVYGVEVEQGEDFLVFRARKAVVLASGGFSANAEMRPNHAPYADQHRGLPPETNMGEGTKMATDIGARLGNKNFSDYCFTPVSCVGETFETEIRHPHFVGDRCLPGCIAVGSSGRRFVNEGCSYHDFVKAMHASGTVPAFLICDFRFLRKYGLGLVRPFPFPYGKFIANGYLVRSLTIGGLASKLSIDPIELAKTVARVNEYAKTGVDLEFRKGDDACSRSHGDAKHGPNPCLGFIAKGPYFAIRLYPGDTGTTCGLVTNANAQVLDSLNQPIQGLYACGMDMDNPTMGAHPSPGSNIGPAIVFGYHAACHIANLRSG